MKRIGCIALCLVLWLTACGEPEAAPETVRIEDQNEYETIQPVGQVPEEYQAVVEENLLCGIHLSGEYFFRVQVEEDNFRIDKYDFQLQVTASCRYTPECGVLVPDSSEPGGYEILCSIGSNILATSDGGFLFTVFSTDDSCVVKCGPDGKVQWRYDAGARESWELELPVELDDCYYLLGTVETQPGESYTDVHILQLDAGGQLVREASYGGSDFDWMKFCRVSGGGLEVWITTQSRDGDFSASPDGYGVDIIAQVGADLELQSFRLTKSTVPEPLGMLDGETVYAGEGILENYAWGRPTAVIDLGAQYLVISENITGRYPDQPPYISAIWYYTETVYSAYDERGNLLWRATVDSSPDYGAMCELVQPLEEAGI